MLRDDTKFDEPRPRHDAAPGSAARRHRLTNREIEVLDLLARGFGNKAIAAELFIGTETVKSHLKSIFRKLDVRTRGEAASRVLSNPLMIRRPVPETDAGPA